MAGIGVPKIHGIFTNVGTVGEHPCHRVQEGTVLGFDGKVGARVVCAADIALVSSLNVAVACRRAIAVTLPSVKPAGAPTPYERPR